MSYGAIAAAAAGATAGGLSAISNWGSSKYAVRKQLQWERERATHAHQWEVQDLKKAGLNPILSAGGQGATTGGISAPLPDMSGIGNAITYTTDLINTALAAKKNQAETANLNANTLNTVSDTEIKNSQKALVEAQTISEMARSGLISAQKANFELKNVEQKFNNERQNATWWNNFINTATGSAKNVAQAGDIAVDLVKNKLIGKTDKGIRKTTTYGKGWKEEIQNYL